MNKIKGLLRVLSGKAVLCAVLTLLFAAASAPLFAQSAEVRYAGVFYRNPNAGTTTENKYCDWDITGSTETISISVNKNSNNKHNRSFTTDANPTGNQNQSDPWVSSGLIEYDQPYPSATPASNKYPNHCLALCMNVRCTNRPMSMSTYSIAFPLQQIKFDVVKYYNGKNIEDVEGTPSIRTINLYPNTESNNAKCGSYSCPGGANSKYTCANPTYELIGNTCCKINRTNNEVCDKNENCLSSWTTSDEWGCADYRGSGMKTGECGWKYEGIKYNNYKEDLAAHCPNQSCTFVIFNEDGTPSNQDIPFCAAWDGSYEIAGEFGKSNGDFGFRATVATDVPGDNIITDKITFNSTIAYPGMNQIPIQVDVTNVHAVRSTPTVVGNITAGPLSPTPLLTV